MISCDYLFITAKGVFAYEEFKPAEGEEFLKVLVVFDGETKSLFAHAIPKKGLDEHGYIVDQVAQDVIWLGHSRVVVRSDNEPAIVKLVTEALKKLKVSGLDQAAAEGSVPYDPQTNGAAESAVNLTKGMMRTLQLCLEDRVGARIPVTHPVMSWLVRHAAQLRTLRVRGRDGQTAYQRARGTESSVKLIGFGEFCRYKLRSQEKPKNGLPWKWHMGIWLGVDRLTSQYMFWDNVSGSIRYARTFMRLPDVQKWSSEKLSQVRATPWTVYAEKEPEVVFQEKQARDAQEVREVNPMVRKLYIRQTDLEQHGYTSGCPRCEHTMTYGPNQSGVPHSDRCRARLQA